MVIKYFCYTVAPQPICFIVDLNHVDSGCSNAEPSEHRGFATLISTSKFLQTGVLLVIDRIDGWESTLMFLMSCLDLYYYKYSPIKSENVALILA